MRIRYLRNLVFSFAAVTILYSLEVSRQLSLTLVLVHHTFEYVPAAPKESCAINLYGLPRSFKALTLPSLVQNVILPNARHQCDYFIHYMYLLNEPAGRDNHGGVLNPDEILLIEDKIREVAAASNYTYTPTVVFRKETEEEFLASRHSFLHKVFTTPGVGHPFLYVPHHQNFPNASVVNIVKMWSGQEHVWNLMNAHEREQNKRYIRVAMMRSDVVYRTPVDIYKHMIAPIIMPSFQE
jgi:hypothetical protein